MDSSFDFSKCSYDELEKMKKEIDSRLKERDTEEKAKLLSAIIKGIQEYVHKYGNIYIEDFEGWEFSFPVECELSYRIYETHACINIL